MIRQVGEKIQFILKEKQVGLALICNQKGEILWHYGRNISGNNVMRGNGFIRKPLIECMNRKDAINCSTGMVAEECRKNIYHELDKIKKVYVQPVNRSHFIYLDSPLEDSFCSADRELFSMMFELFENLLARIRKLELNVRGVSGSSDAVRKISSQIERYAVEDEPVLLTGETGVGKNHVASMLHRLSGRPGHFVVAHTPAIPEHLFEREFFGHCRGAFTDAKTDREGLVAAAENGTLFLDEITEVPASFQAKLLRFIETRCYRPLGDSREKTADVRIVSATNQNIASRIDQNLFRQDLFFRIQILKVHIPPLRERREDIKVLIRENIELLKGKKTGDDFWNAMLGYEWPGNIRELKTLMKRAGILLDPPISGKKIKDLIDRKQEQRNGADVSDQSEGIWEQLCAGASFWNAVKEPFLNRDVNRREVVRVIEKALQMRNGKYRKIMDLMNLDAADYKKFMNFVHQHGLRSEN